MYTQNFYCILEMWRCGNVWLPNFIYSSNLNNGQININLLPVYRPLMRHIITLINYLTPLAWTFHAMLLMTSDKLGFSVATTTILMSPWWVSRVSKNRGTRHIRWTTSDARRHLKWEFLQLSIWQRMLTYYAPLMVHLYTHTRDWYKTKEMQCM